MSVIDKLAGHEVCRKVNVKIFYYWEVTQYTNREQIQKTVKFSIRKEKQLGLDAATGIQENIDYIFQPQSS